MITIVVCYRNPLLLEKLIHSIEETIGVPYEILAIDNTKNNYSIFNAYNHGVKSSNYGIICFTHEDIQFHSVDWGYKVIEHFKIKNLGLIGVVGSHFLPKSPSGWYQPQVTSGGCIQRFYNDESYSSEKRIDLHRFNGNNSIEAVAIDGMWFCIPKHLFSQISFDEKTFTGFHCYDIDICLQIKKLGYQVRIISDIVIEHFSYGNFTTEWVKNTNLLYEKWKDHLPMVAGVQMSAEEMKIRDDMVAETYLWMKAHSQCRDELQNIRSSKAYIIGRKLLKPLKYLKHYLSVLL